MQVRCGASEVFRAGGCDSITDEDIDSILDKGDIDCNYCTADFALHAGSSHLAPHHMISGKSRTKAMQKV